MAATQDLYRFYLLEKKSSGYVSIGHGELTSPADHSVKVIEDAARAMIREQFDLPSAVGIKIKLDVYQATPITHSDQALTYGSLATRTIWEQ